jgi:uncharacterized protein
MLELVPETEFATTDQLVIWRGEDTPPDVAVLFHSLLGNGFKAGKEVVRIAEAFRARSTVPRVAKTLGLPPAKVHQVVNQLVLREMVIPLRPGEKLIERQHSDRSLQTYPLRLLRLYVTKTCNMACTYCFEPEHNGPRMDLHTLTRAVRGFRAWLDEHPDQSYELVKLNFFGGEPLVCKDLLREAVPVMRGIMRDLDGKYKITMNTNATLITPEVAQWLVDNRIMVYTSLDGLFETNDAQRVFRDGRGSFEAVTRGLQRLVEAGDADYVENFITILCTVSSRNMREVEMLADYLYDLGIRNLAFNAAFSCAAHSPGTRDGSHWTSMSRGETREFVQRMVDLQRRLITKNFHIGGMWAYVPERLRKGGTVFCQAVGNEIGVSYDGKLYPCPTTLDNPDACIGHLEGDRFAFNHVSYEWKGRTNDKMEKCGGCSIKGICRGGCPASAQLNGHDIYEPHQCDYWFSIVDAFLETYTREAGQPAKPRATDADRILVEAVRGSNVVPLKRLVRKPA